MINPKNIALIGASSAIGNALKIELNARFPFATIHAFSRSSGDPIDYNNEETIANAAMVATMDHPLEMVLVCNGILHDGEIKPEKSLRELSAEKFRHIFEVNTIVPALIAKHFLPKLNRTSPSIFAAISARVGSISDNRLGGWYAYRASKAALNMVIKNAAIEIGRQNKQAIIVGLHPGTVDSSLSKPFQGNVPKGKLFTPEYSAQKLLDVLLHSTVESSGKCFAWDGQEIKP